MIRLKYVSPAGISRFKTWVNSLPQAIDSILSQAANNIQREAKSNAPVATGALRAGIIVTKIQDGYMVYASINYSRWQEEGTSRGLKGAKFMYNAMIGEASNITGQAVTVLKFR